MNFRIFFSRQSLKNVGTCAPLSFPKQNRVGLRQRADGGNTETARIKSTTMNSCPPTRRTRRPDRRIWRDTTLKRNQTIKSYQMQSTLSEQLPPVEPIKTTMESIRNILIGHPFFSGLSEPYLYLLESLAAFEHFEAHQQIFESGATADKFYLIHKGKIALQTQFLVGRGIMTIQHLGAGEALGWSWLFPPYEWRFGAIAVEPTDTLVFNAEDLRKQAQSNCYFGYELAMRVGGVLLKRLQATRSQLIESQK